MRLLQDARFYRPGAMGNTQVVAHQTPDTSPAPLSAATSTHLTVSDSGNSEFLDFDLPVGFAVQPVSATV